jgi:hypothetical protein
MAIPFHATLTLANGQDLLVHRPDALVEICRVDEGEASPPLDAFEMGALGLCEDDVCFFYEAISLDEISHALQRNFPGCTNLVVIPPPELKPSSIWRLRP